MPSVCETFVLDEMHITIDETEYDLANFDFIRDHPSGRCE